MLIHVFDCIDLPDLSEHSCMDLDEIRTLEGRI